MTKELDKLARLLNQAERASTQEEADAFMEKAQKLSTLYSIGLSEARMHTVSTERRKVPVTRSIRLNDGKWTFGGTVFIDLFLDIARINDVKCNVYSNKSGVIAFGFEDDIDLVESLYASLVLQLVNHADRYIRSGVYKEEKVHKYNKKTDEWELKPIHGRAARRSFMIGFCDSITRKLRRIKNETVKEATAASESTALAVRNKELEVIDYYVANSRARGSYSGAGPATSHGAYGSGREAGERARIGTTDNALSGGRKALN